MYNTKVFLSVATLMGTSLAQIPTGVYTASSCVAILSGFTDVPTPAPALASYISSLVLDGPVTAPGQTTALPGFTLEDPVGYQDLFCSIASDLPESLVPEFQSYGLGLLSYGSVHLSEYDAFVTECITTGAAASTLTSELHKMLTNTGGLCQAPSTTTPAGSYPTGSSNGTSSTGTGSFSTPTSSATLIPTGAAARPTGAIVGAAAIGGLLGVVALL
ncbi:hypothetical protein E0Z10_g5897 [Xylaria hypoxylon]|uniref:Infection structure specific protein n=1 Tax=Xylaria hypoxylon TaxID=37992 RepID=A0A4Z0YZT8_9PEZI|nr:hypothetical protein E0Z10_g5897 [Xylaria hypoxylon]